MRVIHKAQVLLFKATDDLTEYRRQPIKAQHTSSYMEAETSCTSQNDRPAAKRQKLRTMDDHIDSKAIHSSEIHTPTTTEQSLLQRSQAVGYIGNQGVSTKSTSSDDDGHAFRQMRDSIQFADRNQSACGLHSRNQDAARDLTAGGYQSDSSSMTSLELQDDVDQIHKEVRPIGEP